MAAAVKTSQVDGGDTPGKQSFWVAWDEGVKGPQSYHCAHGRVAYRPSHPPAPLDPERGQGLGFSPTAQPSRHGQCSTDAVAKITPDAFMLRGVPSGHPSATQLGS